MELSNFDSYIVPVTSFESFKTPKNSPDWVPRLKAFRSLKQHTNLNQGTCPNKQEMNNLRGYMVLPESLDPSL